MANITHTIDLIFQGIDNVSNQIGDIGNSVESLGNKISGIGDNFSAAAAPIASLQKSILAIEASIGAIGAAAAIMASEFKNSALSINAQLDITEDKANELAEITKKIFAGTDLATDMEDATNSVVIAFRSMKEQGIDAIEGITNKALLLRKHFDLDVNEGISAASTLMDNFGLSSDQAFDFLAAGFQKGLNRADDFIESVEQYSLHFSSANLTAEDFFSLLETGLQGGVLGADKAADAFKEMTLKMADIRDTSSGISEALKELGIDSIKMADDMKAGNINAGDAMNVILLKLKDVDDANERTRLGAEIIGAQYEDLKDRIFSLDLTKTKLEDIQGAADKLNLDSLEKSFTAAWRTITSEIATLPLWDGFLEKSKNIFDEVALQFPESLKKVDFSELTASIDELGRIAQETISGLFDGADITTVEGLQEILQKIIDSFTNLQKIIGGVTDAYEPLFKIIGSLFSVFSEMDGELATTSGRFIAIASQIGLAGAAISTFGTAWTSMAGIVTIGTGALTGATAAFRGLTLASGGWITAAAAVGVAVGTLANHFEIVRKAAQEAIRIIDEAFEISGFKTKAEIKEIDKNFQAAKESAQKFQDTAKDGATFETGIFVDTETAQKQIEDFERLNKTLESFKVLLETTVDKTASADAKKQMEDIIKSIEKNVGIELDEAKANEVSKKLEKLKEKYKIISSRIETGLDSESLDSVKGEFQSLLVELTGKLVPVKAIFDEADKDNLKKDYEETIVTLESGKVISIRSQIDKASAIELEQDLEKLVPPEKRMSIKAELEIANIKAETERAEIMARSLDNQFEWKAQLDIANVQANAEIAKAAFDTSARSIESSGDVILGLVNSIDDAGESTEELGQKMQDTSSEVEGAAEQMQNAFSELASETAGQVADLLSEFDKIVSEIEVIDQQIIDITASSEEKIRSIRRSEMSDEEQYKDKILEYYEKYNEAVEKSASGEYAAAQQLFDEAANVAASIASGNQEWGDTNQRAIDLINQATDAQTSMLETQKETLKIQKDTIANTIEDTLADLSEVRDVVTSIAPTISFDKESAIKDIDEIFSQAEDSEVRFNLVGSDDEGETGLTGKIKGIRKMIKDFPDEKTVRINLDTYQKAHSDSASFEMEWLREDALRKEIENRKNLVDSQTEYMFAQTKNLEKQNDYLSAKTKRIESGDPWQISVKSEGLAPHLQMIWTDILKELQVLVNEEGGELLLELAAAGAL